MRLVVLDTNVIVSAGIRPDGVPARLIMDWVLDGAVQPVTCPYIVDEYRKVMRREKFHLFRFPPVWLEFLIDESLQLPDPPPWPYHGADPNDLPFLALAAQSGAWLVTGNLKHYPAEIRGKAVALSPAAYLSHLGEKSTPEP